MWHQITCWFLETTVCLATWSLKLAVLSSVPSFLTSVHILFNEYLSPRNRIRAALWLWGHFRDLLLGATHCPLHNEWGGGVMLFRKRRKEPSCLEVKCNEWSSIPGLYEREELKMSWWVNSLLCEWSLLILGSFFGLYFVHHLGALTRGCWSLLGSFFTLVGSAQSLTGCVVLRPIAMFTCPHLSNAFVFPCWEECGWDLLIWTNSYVFQFI